MYWLKPVRGAIGVRSRRFKCTVSIGKSTHELCPLYRVCPLFGGSGIRGFTVQWASG